MNPRRVIVILLLILIGLILVGLQQRGQVQPLFLPTPTATREPHTFAAEGDAHFAAGHLKEAAAAYIKATQSDPKNLDYWVALARIQIYGKEYEKALESAETALLVAPNDAKSKAIHAWALDWNAQENHTGCACRTLAEAEAAAVQAIALDSNYAPAHAYYSEILNDSQKWAQGYEQAEMALSLDPSLLEAHRAMGYANESVGNYETAILHYKNALALNPNLIAIYLRLGLNYRVLRDYDQAIFYFSKANAIDPYDVDPYLYLSRTHYQNDELGTAVQYLEQALTLEPWNPDIHGRLGLILFKRRNYEGAEPELGLAVIGGSYDGNETPDDPSDDVDVLGMSLNAASLEYYYTYGNLLAYLHKCQPQEAPTYLDRALAFAPDDPTVLGSYEESMALCQSFLAGVPLEAPLEGTPPAEATPTPAP